MSNDRQCCKKFSTFISQKGPIESPVYQPIFEKLEMLYKQNLEVETDLYEQDMSILKLNKIIDDLEREVQPEEQKLQQLRERAIKHKQLIDDYITIHATQAMAVEAVDKEFNKP